MTTANNDKAPYPPRITLKNAFASLGLRLGVALLVGAFFGGVL